MKKNYKLQNTNYKQITNYKLQIKNKVSHELHELTRISEKKETSITTTTKGSRGLHRGSFKLQTMTALIKSFCGGGGSVSQWVSGSVGQKVRSSRVRLKASKHSLHANYNALSNFQHFAAFPVDSVHLKKPSVGPKGLIGPPCHGAPGRRRQIKWN